MGTTQPIRNRQELQNFSSDYKQVKPHLRNYTLVVLGLNTALRISDLLNLRWRSVYDFDTKRDGVRCEIIETGEVFNSLQACADRLGVSARWLNRVSQGKGLYSVHGYHIKRSDIKPSVNRGGRPGVKVRCIETGEVYNSITSCAEAIGGTPSRIHDIIHGSKYRHTHHGLHFEIYKK